MPKLILGLTGGIASGKSAVADRLAQLGAQIIDTDQIAREVVEPGQPALAQLVTHFGPDILTDDGCLDRAKLRARVFANTAERKWLESLLHPLIRQIALERAASTEADWVVLVVPLLFESGQYDQTDLNLVVDVSESVQRARVLARDGISEAQVAQILAAQMSREERLKKADLVIENSGSLDQLDTQVDQLYRSQIQPRLI